MCVVVELKFAIFLFAIVDGHFLLEHGVNEGKSCADGKLVVDAIGDGRLHADAL